MMSRDRMRVSPDSVLLAITLFRFCAKDRPESTALSMESDHGRDDTKIKR